MNGSQRLGGQTPQKLIDRKTGQVLYDPAERLAIHVSPQVQRHLRAYGRNNIRSAEGNLSLIAEVALSMAMMHREFIQEATDRCARYARAEGFEPGQHAQLITSLLEAR